MTDFAAARRRMVDTQLVARGIRHPAVLRAMATVPRRSSNGPFTDTVMPLT